MSLGVAVGMVGEVVKTVVSGLTEMTIDTLPADHNKWVEGGILSQIHVAEKLLENENATLQLE